ncbi:MAG: hypothetical protein L0Y35_03185 [Flammeovirgaceae bacterium]|nr:hypothetical protein [Flammeovirgaceae bacterium]
MQINLPLKQKIVSHINYRDVFNAPVSLYELQKWLDLTGSKVMLLKNELNSLVDEGLLETPDVINYCVVGRSALLREKGGKERLSERVINQNIKILKCLSWIPWVRFIGISGSIAVNNPTIDVVGLHKGTVDLDVFIITSRYSLWMIFYFERLMTNILTFFLGNKYMLCFNYAMDFSFLEIHNKNMYTATELFNLKPICDKNETYQKLLESNQWAIEYYPMLTNKLHQRNTGENSRRFGKILGSIRYPVNFLMFILFQISRAIKNFSVKPLLEASTKFDPSMGVNLERICPSGGGYQKFIEDRFKEKLQKNFPAYFNRKYIDYLFPTNASVERKATWARNFSEMEKSFAKYSVQS